MSRDCTMFLKLSQNNEHNPSNLPVTNGSLTRPVTWSRANFAQSQTSLKRLTRDRNCERRSQWPASPARSPNVIVWSQPQKRIVYPAANGRRPKFPPSVAHTSLGCPSHTLGFQYRSCVYWKIFINFISMQIIRSNILSTNCSTSLLQRFIIMHAKNLGTLDPRPE